MIHAYQDMYEDYIFFLIMGLAEKGCTIAFHLPNLKHTFLMRLSLAFIIG